MAEASVEGLGSKWAVVPKMMTMVRLAIRIQFGFQKFAAAHVWGD
jgi:hypothetical protein